MKKTILISVCAIAASVTLLGCGHHGHHHQHGPITTAAPTTPMQTTVSVPVMQGGYEKVVAAPGTRLYFLNLRNGQTITNPVRVVFGLSGMGVAPAGLEKEGTGHHHLLIDVASLDVNTSIPANDNHRHFGLGQTEAVVTMVAGTHTLQLVLADHNHIPHHPPVMSERITITVK